MILVTCPYCESMIEIIQINCGIFRHACYKDTLIQISPHTNEQDCINLINSNNIYGCCKPFKVMLLNNIYTACKCDYI
jgi:hypothetical protein